MSIAFLLDFQMNIPQISHEIIDLDQPTDECDQYCFKLATIKQKL
jgi:hypothetical protein